MIKKPIRVTLILLLAVFSFAAKAQQGKQTSLGIGTEVIVPIRGSYNGSNFDPHTSFGINLKLEKPITSALHFTVGTGVTFLEADRQYLNFYAPAASFLPSDINSGYDKAHNVYVYLPVTAGLKYYLVKYLYVNAEAGGAFKASSRSSTSFLYLGGAGAVVPIGAHHGLDFGVQFERSYKNIDYGRPMSQLGFHAAYKYRF